MSKLVKNNSGSTQKYGGVVILDNATYPISTEELLKFQTDTVLLNHLTGTTPLASIIDESQPNIELTGASAVAFLLDQAPVNFDQRPINHSTPRPRGAYTYFSSADDDHTDPHAVGGSSNVSELFWEHTVGGDNPEVFYLDYNTISNTTFVRQGDIMWKDAVFDYMNFEIVPKTTTYTSGTDTNYDLYGGYLIIPAVGDGTITVQDADRVLVECTMNEFGDYPAGYWDADWNTTTKEFENITPNYTGEGGYNMFAAEVLLHRFMNRRRLLGTSRKDCHTEDVSQLGHNVRLKVSAYTHGTDHDWSGCATMMLYRSKTC